MAVWGGCSNVRRTGLSRSLLMRIFLLKQKLLAIVWLDRGRDHLTPGLRPLCEAGLVSLDAGSESGTISVEGWGARMRYEAPDTIAGAVALLVGEGGLSRVLAGGTDVLVQLRSGMVEPDLLVDIKRIPGMFDVAEEAGGWRIGAAVPGAMLGEHAGVTAAWPGVVEALELVGSTQIQGRATLAGNLCNASPAADSVPAMIAAGAMVRIEGPGGTRDLPVAEVCTGPGKTSLAKGEIVTSILLPARPARSGDAYLRFIPRTEMDIAVVGCGISLVLDGDKIAKATVALGAVGPTAFAVPEAAAVLIGTTGDAAAMEALAAACSAAARPIDDKRGTVAFRTEIAGVLAKRAAATAIARAKG